MGPYLGQPNKEKDSENGDGDYCAYGATSMQGWRKSQEDAHIAHFLDDGVSLFGVFDGHGGKEVSILVKDKFAEMIQKLESYKSKQYDKALKEVFYEMDKFLESDEGNEALKKIQEDHSSPD